MVLKRWNLRRIWIIKLNVFYGMWECYFIEFIRGCYMEIENLCVIDWVKEIKFLWVLIDLVF